MAINFGLAQPSGGYDYLETLRALGQQQLQQQQIVSQRQQDTIQGYKFDRLQQQDAGRQRIATQVRSGDMLGGQKEALLGGDTDYAEAIGALDTAQKAQLQRQLDTLGTLYPQVKGIPAEQRAARAIPALKMAGYTDAELANVDWSDAGIEAAYRFSKAGQAVLAAQIKAAEPRVVGDGGALVDGSGRVLYENARDAKWQFDSESGSWLQQPGTGTGGSVPQPGYTQGGGGPASNVGTGRGAVALSGNNPGGINDGAFARSQPGYTGANGRFAGFATLQDGVNAQKALLRSYIERGYDTPAKIARRWAPAADGNDPRGYASNIASMLGVSPNTKLSPADVDRFQDAQARQENAMYPQAMSRAGGGQAASGQPGVINVRPPKKGDGYRLLTAQEKQAQGLDVGTQYQISGKGQITALGGQEKGGGRKAEADFRKEFDALPEVKTFKTTRQQFNTLREIAGKAKQTGADDLAIIFNFMKALDPASVVREGEFLQAANSSGLIEGVGNKFQRARDGRWLSDQQRKDMVRTAYENYKTTRSTYNQAAENYRGYARDNGINPDRVARTYTPDRPRRQPQRAAIGVGQSTQVGGFKVTRVK